MSRLSLAFTLAFAFLPRTTAAPPECVAPINTVELAVVPDLAALEKHFGRSQLAKIYTDPSMRAFFDGHGPELLGLFELPDAIGLKWEQVKPLAGGSLASASVPLADRQLGTIVMLDVHGHLPAARTALESAAARATKTGATVRDQSAGGSQVTVWSLPDGPGKRRPVGVVIKDDLLMIADPPETLAPVLSAWGDAKRSLSASLAYQAIRARTAMKSGEPAHLVWFFDPFGWDAATRPPVLTGKKKRAKDVVEVLRQEGFDGIKAVGGSAAFEAGECDVLVRSAIYAPKPYRSALQMLAFRPGTDQAPAAGLPGELAAGLVTRIDPVTAFESFGGIFDELAADGEKGTYKELINDLRDNPKGPRVDLRKDIVGQLGEVVTLLSDCERPLGPSSERAAAIFTLKDEKVVAAAIRRAVEDDPKAKRVDIGGRTVWEIVPDPPATKPGEPAPPPLPNAALCVADGKLYIATQATLLDKLFRPAGQRLAAQADYQRVCRQFERLGDRTACARLFARPDEDLRLTYEMWRQGRLDQATSIYGMVLNGLLPKNPATNTVWHLDGRKLPEYDVVSRHLGPAGLLLFLHDEGWDGIAILLAPGR